MKVNEHILSAMKRNDRRELTALIFDACGNGEAAEEIRAASRITSALIDRVSKVEKGESTPEPETAKAEKNDLERLNISELKALVATGKKKKIKKAKKLFDKQFAEDYKGRDEIEKDIFG